MKQFFFLSGLPRSGSTLLSSILNQNPEIYASSNSPVRSAMSNTYFGISSSEQFLAYPKPEALSSTVLGILENYYSDTDCSIVIDKSREWPIPENFEVLKAVLPYTPKTIVTTRDILDVLASFISLAENSSSENSMLDKNITTEDFNFYRPANDIRCDYLMKPKGVIDNAMYGIANALSDKKSFHFVDYEDLVSETGKTIEKIYNFLGIPKFSHDFDNVVNNIKENDDIYGLSGMHEVRPSISKREISYRDVLSEYVINKYSNLEFWK